MLDEIRRLHRRQIARLRDLSVDVEELSAEQSREALLQFAAAFLGAEGAMAFLAEVEAARDAEREVSYGRWLRHGHPPPSITPRFGWLTDWKPKTRCIRFDRRVALPALSISTGRMQDEWALTWPGAYVSFETWRAMVVSLDYEVSCFDLRAAGALRERSPYR